MKNGRLIAILAALAISGLLVSPIAMAADSLCARVKIEIKQELTLERQAFEARMKITNGTNMDMANLGVEVLFTDADGNPVVASSDPDHTSASFFIRVDTLENVSGVDGTGTVGAGVEARITWLIIPAPGTGGQDPNGQMYYVGAKLSYNLGGDDNETEVVPDYIFVRPMPSLTLDYFLPHEVYGDDPFTQETEPEIPFSLGVRITNSGYGPARSLKIDSGQPEIIENDLGLLIDFRIHATEVNGKPAINSLLADFGDIESMHSAVARWVMTASLSGTFVEFDATFTHADELGGKLTSLIQDPIHTHLLVRDVLVDLNGRDNSRDFLVKDDDFLRVYESEGGDHPVTDYSQDSGIAPGRGNLEYQMNVPLAPAAFLFAKLLDPQAGTMAIAYVERSDGKTVKPENAWLSKTSDRNGNWTYYINIFDFNREGSRADRGDNLYTVVYGAPVRENEPPVLGFIADKSVQATQFLGFLVEASDPDGATPSLEIDTLPGGATFTDNGNGTGSFSWNPLVVQTGVYHVIFTAYDSADRSANDAQAVTITVRSETGTPIVTFAQTASQGDEGTTPVNIEVKLDQPAPAGGVTVTYGIAGGSTAESPADFALPGTQLVFAEGEDTKTIALAIVDDALGEASETVILDLSSPVNATLGAPIRHTHTILESDGGPDVRYLLVGAGGANNGLFRFNADTGEFVDDLAAGAGVDGPAGMMFGPDGSLYLASSASNKIYRWVSGTRGFQEFSAVPALDGPQGMTFGPDGGLYVANGTANQILRLDAATGSLLGVFSTASELNAPRGIVFGPDGHLYVCNSGTNQIVRIDSADGSFLDVFAEDSDLADPPDLVFGPDGDLYVSSRGSVNAVLRFEGLSGAYIDTFTSGTQPGRPAGLTFGPDGNLYVADETGDNVLRYDGGTGAFQDGFIAPIRATVTPGFLLFTNFAPTVETPPASQTVLVGQSVALSVGSAGSATLFHQWQKGGVDILGATSSLLVIPGAANGDAGEYRCVVSNGFGQATSPSAQIVVQTLPQMQFTLTLSQVDENDGTVHVEVSQDAISPLDTTIGISVIGGTAIPDQNRVEPDFKLLVGSVTIVAGQTTAQADLQIYTDANPEDDETVVLELAGPTNAVLGTNTVHTMTIRDATTTPDPDSDGDGMLDAWEMHIIDAAPDDPFATIADVLPGDDFDA
ncbi:MAG: hypothetical protein KAI66_17630, partial [Lentisphaeria bacterium]|nr:hypothetical protein [Lentisphaeria bacterium]